MPVNRKKQPKPDVYVFDADDTLWMNAWQYDHARAEFFRTLYEMVPGPHIPSIRYLHERYNEINDALFPEWGVRRGRVAESMALLYREICAWARWRFNEDHYRPEFEARVRAIGDFPFDYTKLAWLPEARALLLRLKERGHRLCLLSCYDTAVFPHRMTHLNVFEFFEPEHVHATEHRKTPDDFLDVSGYASDRPCFGRWFAVGNGESDITPALSLGDEWYGIYVPHGTTSPLFKDSTVIEGFRHPEMNHPRVKTYRSLEEAQKNL